MSKLAFQQKREEKEKILKKNSPLSIPSESIEFYGSFFHSFLFFLSFFFFFLNFF